MSTHPTLLNHRYQLHEKLGQGAMGVVHRATDRLTGQVIALKQVTTQLTPQPTTPLHTGSTPHSLGVLIAHEFQLLASLRHPHIITVLDYGFAADVPYFTMTYLEECVPLTLAGKNASPHTKINWLIQLLQALSYLHRQGVLHRDLKPDNVLIVNDIVQVVDFGLAWDQEAEQGQGGTPFYMAPEVLQGQATTAAADLYAVGVMAYELFAGRHPFVQEGANTLIDILTMPANLAPLDVAYPVQDVIGRLLAKLPADRYPSAEATMQALAQAWGITLPPESVAIRESYLQAAKFVGRQTELQQLLTALDNAQQGHGTAWLIRGESGIGKSRLLDELRTRALVQGMVVLRGQGVTDGGGLSNQLWRTAIRQLLLMSEVTDLTVGILSILVPDIGHLLEREVIPPPTVDPPAAQKRLHRTITDLFQQAPHPILLILEDLQWAIDSLEPLRQLNALVSTLPLLIVGSYRSDETPDLPQHLPTMQVMTLPRLDMPAIQRLSHAMLGKTGQHPRILNFLQQETEGNAFFLVEVVRALAEEAGQLSAIDGMLLPEKVFPQGIQTVVDRQLAKVPTEARPLLNLAAVAGRELEMPLIATLLAQTPSSLSVQEWLQQCLAVRVLEIYEGQPRFSHEKLRMGILTQLGDTRPQHHTQVAQAIESIYPHAPQQAARLVYHWHEAGNTSKEEQYAEIAGSHAMATYNYAEAISHLERALTLKKQKVEPPTAEWETLYTQLGKAYEFVANYDAALSCYQQLEAIGVERHDKHLQLAAFLKQSHVYAIPNSHMDLSYIDKLNEIALPLARQLNDVAAEAKILWQLSLFYPYANKMDVAFQVGQQALALARTHNLTEQIAYSLQDLSMAYELQGNPQKGQAVLEEAQALWRQLDNKAMLVDNLNTIGGKYASCGDYTTAIPLIEEAIAISHQIDNRWNIAYGHMNLGDVYFSMGDFAQAIPILENGIQWGKESGFTIASVLTGTLLGLVYAYLEQLERGMAYVQQALTDAQNFPLGFRIGTLAASGQIALWQGDKQTAASYFQQIAGIKDFPPHHEYILRGLYASWLIEQEQYEEAITYTTNAIANATKVDHLALRPNLRGYQATALAKLDQWQEAKTTFAAARAEAQAMKQGLYCRQINQATLKYLAHHLDSTSKANLQTEIDQITQLMYRNFPSNHEKIPTL